MPWALIAGACTNGKILVTNVEISIATTTTVPPDVNILGKKRDRKGEFMIVDRFQGISLNVIDSDFRKLRIAPDLEYPDLENKECVLSGDELTQYILVNHVSPKYKSLIVSPGVSSRFWASICKEDINKLCSWHAKFGDEHLFVRILVSQYQNDERGVRVADFSSRGPSKVYQNNLTPDVVAPGCSVLMSHPINYALNELEHKAYPHVKKLFKDHKIGSGSSYACPLVAAYALIVYSYHPRWYPSAVKSALITTASSFAARYIPGNEFEFGAGAINLERALDPGLVYEESGLNFQKYVDGKIEIFNLNLPTFAASFSHSHRCCEQTFVRKLKNVTK